MPKRGERGFTLIELLIVVAILGILAAVVIPNVGRFLGRGTTEAQNAEFRAIQTAVQSMMVDNNLTTLPSPVSANTSPCTTGTQDMSAYPDGSVAGTDKGNDINGNAFAVGDGDGWILWQVDITADAATTGLVNYSSGPTTAYCYTVDASGNVTQYDTAGTQTNP
jgi:type IV pilus assembly protein PilA